MYTYIFTHLFIHIYMNTCVYTHRGIISSYPRSLSHFDTLSLHLPLSLLHVRSLFHFVPLSAPLPTPARHKTTSIWGTHSSHAPCAHERWREKPAHHVRRGFENPHPACGVGSNCNTLQHAHTISLSFLALSLPPSLSLSLSLSFTDLHTRTRTHART